jgi:prepilin-type N-terminal cleavage/methylation domain-containing protein
MTARRENRRDRRPSRRRFGFTLLELAVTTAVVGAMMCLAVPRLTRFSAASADVVTQTTLAEVRRAIVDGYWPDMYERLPYPVDSRRAAYPQLAYLYLNPQTYGADVTPAGTTAWTFDPLAKRGWSGPYLTGVGVYRLNAAENRGQAYGENGDPAPLDGWGRAIVLQQPLESAGAPSAVDRRFARLVSAGPNGRIDAPPDVLELSLPQIGDDLVLYLTP